MSISSMRYCLVAMAALSMSGCYSGGRWTMPDLAFWKTNPFSSSGKSAATEPIPRPSELASQPSPAPGAGYTPTSGNTAETMAPPYAGASPASVGQQPYASTQTPAGVPTSPYMAPQQGYYEANAVAGAATAYPVTNPYAPASTPSASAAPAQDYGSNPYGVPVAHESPTPFGSGQTAASPQNYGMPAGANPGYVAANPSGPYANPVRNDSQDPYDQRLADYRSSAGPYGSAVPGYRTDQEMSNQADNYRNQPVGDYRSQPAGDYRNQPVSDYRDQSTNDSRGTASGYPPNQALPSQQSPAGYQAPPDYNSNSGYQATNPAGQSAGGYSPGNTGYTPPGVAPYQPPAGMNTSPLAEPTSDSGYSPGSVSRYNSY